MYIYIYIYIIHANKMNKISMDISMKCPSFIRGFSYVAGFSATPGGDLGFSALGPPPRPRSYDEDASGYGGCEYQMWYVAPPIVRYE